MNNIHGKILILGTGASSGVPVVGCHCPVCESQLSENKRFRTSALLTVNNKNILIDCGPDFRSQALIYHIDTLDGLILTHAHSDHTAGIDDLKIYCVRSKSGLPCLLSKETQNDILHRFSYLFSPKDGYKGFTTHLELQLLPQDKGEINFLGVPIRYFTYKQMGMDVNGLRFGDLTFVTDICDYTDDIFEDLAGTKTLVLSALRHTHSPMHLTVDQAIDFSRRVGASKTWLIHTSHDLEYEKTNAYLPENVRMAYDGLSLNFSYRG